MYCSLNEAYQIPTFASKKARKAQDPAFDPHGIDEGLSGRAPAYRKYGREDFVDPPSRSGNAENNANRDMIGNPLMSQAASSYAAEASDINYYRKYGMQFPQVSTKEPYADSDGEQCSSKDTTYRLPINDKDKQAYDAAMKVAVDSQQAGKNTQVLPKMRTADMTGVSGYYDEDLENYLKISEMKAAPAPQTQTQTPFESAMAAFKGQLVPRQENMAAYPPAEPDTKNSSLLNDYLMDLLLFILIGVLVIFLCDQLYRLAVMTGMRDTVEIIRPYIEATLKDT